MNDKMSNQTFTCECCGSENVTLDLVTSVFEYKNGKSFDQITVELPVYTCSECEFEYTAQESEMIKHIAICNHLKLLLPEDILNLRTKYALTQAQLAKLTGFGIASIARWESGKLVQSKANDNLLRLLISNPANLVLLRNKEMQVPKESLQPVFTYVAKTKQVEERAIHFTLCSR